jgi:hypothetical protein
LAAEVHDEEQIKEAIKQLQLELDQIESAMPTHGDAASTVQVSTTLKNPDFFVEALFIIA